MEFTYLPLLLYILLCLICFHLLANHEVFWVQLNFIFERNTTKILSSKISFYQCRYFKLLLWMGIKRVSKLPSLSWQKLCSEYRKFVRNGKLFCTRENDPIQGPDGKIHGNTCSMCAAFLWVELLLGKWGRVLSFLLHFSFLELYSILFLKLCLFLINGIFLWHIFAQCHNCQRMIPAYQSLVEFPWKCKWHETRIIPLQSGIWNHLKTHNRSLANISICQTVPQFIHGS